MKPSWHLEGSILGDLHGPLLGTPTPPAQDLLFPLTASLAATPAATWLAALPPPPPAAGAENCRVKPVTLFFIEGIVVVEVVKEITGGRSRDQLAHSEHVPPPPLVWYATRAATVGGGASLCPCKVVLLLAAAYSRRRRRRSLTCAATRSGTGSGSRSGTAFLSLLLRLRPSAQTLSQQSVSQLIDFMSLPPLPPLPILSSSPSFTLRCGP